MDAALPLHYRSECFSKLSMKAFESVIIAIRMLGPRFALKADQICTALEPLSPDGVVVGAESVFLCLS